MKGRCLVPPKWTPLFTMYRYEPHKHVHGQIKSENEMKMLL